MAHQQARVTLHAPQVVAKYYISEKLGSGTYATVYKVCATELQISLRMTLLRVFR